MFFLGLAIGLLVGAVLMWLLKNAVVTKAQEAEVAAHKAMQSALTEAQKAKEKVETPEKAIAARL